MREFLIVVYQRQNSNGLTFDQLNVRSFEVNLSLKISKIRRLSRFKVGQTPHIIIIGSQFPGLLYKMADDPDKFCQSINHSKNPSISRLTDRSFTE